MRSISLTIPLALCLVVPGCNRSTNTSGDIANPDYIEGISDGLPFGEITDADAEALMAFAKEKGVDLQQAAEQANRKDPDALATVLKFSLHFKTLDKNARTYGQIVWSSF